MSRYTSVLIRVAAPQSNVSLLGGFSSVQNQLKAVPHKNAYLILSKYFCYIFSNLNEFLVGQITLILTNIIEISLH